MWVIKLGGSLIGAPELAHWLHTIVQVSDSQLTHRQVIIVPGGGLFADAVRQAQSQSGMSDAVAHHLALLAMDQFGWMLAGMQPKLVTASSALEIAERSWQHRAIVWLPSQMVLADETIPKNWEVTSDSLSAWLAKKLGAKHLVLVKSASRNTLTTQLSLNALMQAGVVDAAFADFYDTNAFKTWVLHKADYGSLTNGLCEKHCLIQS